MGPGSKAAVALCLLALPAAGEVAEVDAQSALSTGNRLFRDGQIEAAIAAYREGYSPSDPHPTLVYNLGAALHHLDRLPEAVLWYRRAAADDPWLEENLWLARRSLGSQLLPAGGALGFLGRHTGALRVAAIVLAWAVLASVIATARVPRRIFLGTVLLAAALYLGAVAIDRWGPRPAVILTDCIAPTGELPAGTEVWVRRSAEGDWSVSGTADATCPAASVGLVFPDR